jgi:hypothetical protein
VAAEKARWKSWVEILVEIIEQLEEHGLLSVDEQGEVRSSGKSALSDKL